MQEFRGRHAVTGPWPRVQGRALVRILAVTQHVGPPPEGTRHARPAGIERDLVWGVGGRVPGRDREIVGRGLGKRLGGQGASLIQREPSFGQRREHVGVPGRLDDDGHRAMVLGGGPDHRGAADVDLLDAPLRRGAGRDRRLERVQVGHQELERLDPELPQLRLVLGVRGIREQARVHPGVQGLHPAVQAFGEAGQLLHAGDRHPGRADPGRGAAGGYDLDAGRVQAGRQLLQAGLIEDADQRTADRDPGHCQPLPSCPVRTSLRGPSCPPWRRAAPARPP